MVMNKVGLNTSALNNLTAPNITIGSGEVVANSLSTTANSQTLNYFGLGVMVTLFLYLVWLLGRGNELINSQYSVMRSVGISAGVVAMQGLMMLNLGFFTEYYHAVIFGGITLLSWLVIFVGSKR